MSRSEIVAPGFGWLLAVIVAAAAGGCAPTGPPASGANSSAPEAVDQAVRGNVGGGSNQFTPGHTVGAPP